MTLNLALLIGIVGFSMLLYFMLNNIMATQLGPGRHRRRRISLSTMIAAVGVWEIAIGAFVAANNNTPSAIGPIGLGIAMIAAPLVARRLRLPGDR